MERIVNYIDDIVVDLNETLNLLTSFGAEEDRIERIKSFIETFNSRNVDEIIKLIESRPSFFYSTPAAPLLYEIDLNNEKIFSELEAGDYKQPIFKYISLESFFSDERAKSWFESLSQSERDSFIEKNLTRFKNDTLEYLSSILKRHSNQSVFLDSLYYDNIKEYVINNEQTARLLIDNLSISSFYITADDYQFLWDNYEAYFKNYSIDKQSNFFSILKQKKPELLPAVLKSLNAVENVSLYGFFFKDIFPYFSDEDKKNIFFKLLQDNKSVDSVLALLPIDTQRELLQDERFLNIEFEDYKRQSAYNAISPRLFDEYMDTEIMTNDRLLHFYKKTNDVKYANKLKDQVLNATDINYKENWLSDSTFYTFFDATELSHIISSIDYPQDVKSVRDFFSIVDAKSRTPFLEKMIANAISFLKENPGIDIPLYIGAQKIFTESEKRAIFDTLSPAKQLSELTSWDEFVKYVAQKIAENPNCYKGGRC